MSSNQLIVVSSFVNMKSEQNHKITNRTGEGGTAALDCGREGRRRGGRRRPQADCRTGGLALAEAGLEARGAAPRSHRVRRDFSMGDRPVPAVRLALAEAGGGTARGCRSQEHHRSNPEAQGQGRQHTGVRQ
jgi:hypothetical protein